MAHARIKHGIVQIVFSIARAVVSTKCTIHDAVVELIRTTTDSSRSSWDQLVSCGGDRYCCYSDGSTCCNDDSKVFTVGAASVIKDLATTGSYTLPIASATATGTYTSRSAKTTNTESSEAKTTSSKATTITAAASATSTDVQTNSDSHSHSTSHLPLIVGAIAGVIILIIAVTLVWFFVRRRYRKKLAAGANGQSFPMSSDGFQKLPDKSPRPVEIPAPMHSPAPPYQPPPYQSPPPQHNAVDNAVEMIVRTYLLGEISGDNRYLKPLHSHIEGYELVSRWEREGS